MKWNFREKREFYKKGGRLEEDAKKKVRRKKKDVNYKFIEKRVCIL